MENQKWKWDQKERWFLCKWNAKIRIAQKSATQQAGCNNNGTSTSVNNNAIYSHGMTFCKTVNRTELRHKTIKKHQRWSITQISVFFVRHAFTFFLQYRTWVHAMAGKIVHNKKNFSTLTWDWELSFLRCSICCLPFSLNLDYVWSNTTWATVLVAYKIADLIVCMECTMWTRWMNEWVSERGGKIHFILAFFKLPTEWVECSAATAKKIDFP